MQSTPALLKSVSALFQIMMLSFMDLFPGHWFSIALKFVRFYQDKRSQSRIYLEDDVNV